MFEVTDYIPLNVILYIVLALFVVLLIAEEIKRIHREREQSKLDKYNSNKIDDMLVDIHKLRCENAELEIKNTQLEEKLMLTKELKNHNLKEENNE